MADQTNKLPVLDFQIHMIHSGFFKRSAYTVLIGQSLSFQNCQSSLSSMDIHTPGASGAPSSCASASTHSSSWMMWGSS